VPAQPSAAAAPPASPGAAPHPPASPPTPAPRWVAPGSGWGGGAAPDLARSAAGWARAVTGRGRVASSPTGTTTPATYLWQSLVCLLLFLPSALVAVVYSTQVNRRVQGGDMTGAVRASRLARTWCLITVAAFTLLVVWMMARGSIL
jgi:Interferon-induced transmembrane protein